MFSLGRKRPRWFSRPIASDAPEWGKSWGCYELKEIGQKEEKVLTDGCIERWDRRNEGYVLKDVICEGFSHYRAEIDGPFVLTRAYGIFTSGEQRDSMVLQIGKCSSLANP
jgi:hypothetical protein